MDSKSEESITFESYKEQIDTWYRANNIIREKSELYYDLLISILDLVDETYLGSDVVQSEEDITNHFSWCFKRVISNFEYERIYFLNNLDNYDYIWYFFYRGYYKSENEDKYAVLLEYFDLLFNYNRIKKGPELESFMDFYKMLDKNLKKTN